MTFSGLDFDQCYRAVASRDARFDGWFIVGVRTTGIYCRPSCPTPVRPKAVNVAFYKSAAAAQLAGFRACKRCRPDAVPGSPEWDIRSDLAGRAIRLIADGMVDRVGVAGLARHLAVSERHLHRILVEAVGAPALAVARSHRAQTARVLIETTGLPFAEIAFGAGFPSIRQFNDTIRSVFAATPTQLRAGARRGRPAPAGRLELRLAVRAPFDGQALLDWFAPRAVTGVEAVSPESYHRVLPLPGGPGTVSLRPAPDHVSASFRLGRVTDLPAAVARCRRLFDLDADPATYGGVLSADAALAPLVRNRPGLRAPGTVDEAETAIRVVIGQQISIGGARTITRRLVEAFGKPLDVADGPLTHAFPTPETLAEAGPAGLRALGLTGARAATVVELARRLADGELVLDPGADRAEARRGLLAIPGIGPWTVEVIALRALRDPDAFPASDLGVRRAAERAGVEDPGRRADRWRPWRGYATQYLWTVAGGAGQDSRARAPAAVLDDEKEAAGWR